MHPAAAPPLLSFEIVLHRRPAAAVPGSMHVDPWGTWPTLVIPRQALGVPMACDFDAACARLAAIDRLHVEADGSFVWAGPRRSAGAAAWQVDGNVSELLGRVLQVDLRGGCPGDAFDRLLGAFGWPAEPMLVQLLRPAVFLDETDFRRHGLARAAGAG